MNELLGRGERATLAALALARGTSLRAYASAEAVAARTAPYAHRTADGRAGPALGVAATRRILRELSGERGLTVEVKRGRWALSPAGELLAKAILRGER